MTSDNDLIRRGDALMCCDAIDIAGLPAATPALDAAAMQRMAADEASRYVQIRSDQIATEKAKPAHYVDIPQVMRWEAGRIQASSIADAILTLPLPTPADRLAEALRLPEVAALVEAAANLSEWSRANTRLGTPWKLAQDHLVGLEDALRDLTREARHD